MPNGKPNILVICGDDIGITNLSCYSDGLMGYRTPTIDRVANEGMRFTDSYGEQSCTAGRAAFITGQSVYRTGMSKVGMPGVDVGLQPADPTIAEMLKPRTDSTSSSATCITSTPKRNPSSRTIRERTSFRACTTRSFRGASGSRRITTR